MTPSTVTRERIAGQLKALTSGLGRARPEVSIRMCSGGDGRLKSFSSAGTKSSATVQHRHPFGSSTMSSLVQPFIPQPSMKEPSKPMSPNSLTSTASRRPSAFSRRWRTSVVLPAPRKPVTTVQGTLLRCGHSAASLKAGARGGMRATTPLRNACGRSRQGTIPSGARA